MSYAVAAFFPFVVRIEKVAHYINIYRQQNVLRRAEQQQRQLQYSVSCIPANVAGA
jgi:hypothetical protein